MSILTVSPVMKTEAVSFLETSVNLYQSMTSRPQDSRRSRVATNLVRLPNFRTNNNVPYV